MFKRRAAVDGYIVQKMGREEALVTSPTARVRVALETMASGKAVCIYSDQSVIDVSEGKLLALYVEIARRGLEELGYEVEIAES